MANQPTSHTDKNGPTSIGIVDMSMNQRGRNQSHLDLFVGQKKRGGGKENPIEKTSSKGR